MNVVSLAVSEAVRGRGLNGQGWEITAAQNEAQKYVGQDRHVVPCHDFGFSPLRHCVIRRDGSKLWAGHGAVPASIRSLIAQELDHSYSTLGGKKRFTLYYFVFVITRLCGIIMISSFSSSICFGVF
jgi:hypothetical protein